MSGGTEASLTKAKSVELNEGEDVIVASDGAKEGHAHSIAVFGGASAIQPVANTMGLRVTNVRQPLVPLLFDCQRPIIEVLQQPAHHLSRGRQGDRYAC